MKYFFLLLLLLHLVVSAGVFGSALTASTASSQAQAWAERVAQQPLDPRVRGNYAVALHRAGRLHDAVVQFEQALSITTRPSPSSHTASSSSNALTREQRSLLLCNVGSSYQALGNTGKAYESFTNALNLALSTSSGRPSIRSSNNNRREVAGNALINLGALLVSEGRYEEAVKLYEEEPHAQFLAMMETESVATATTATTVATLLSNYGNALHQAGRLDDAENLYRRAIAASSPGKGLPDPHR